MSIATHEYLIRNDLGYMTQQVLDLSYSDLHPLIYPHPKYKAFVITKKNGSPRVIQEPYKNLKDIQYKVLNFLSERSNKVKPCVHGFSKGKSILTNAKMHCSPKTGFILNVDIENFFPSITFYRVRGLFQSKPFEFSYEISTVLAHLCTFNGRLPQGAPTSPFISNLICRSMDGELMKLAHTHRAMYTRYADDITFSFTLRSSARLPSSICKYDGGQLLVGHELNSIVEKHSFKLNSSKTRIDSKDNRLSVTGVVVNEFPNVARRYIDEIRGALHAWDAYGYSMAQAGWRKKILFPGTSIGSERRPWRRQTLTGKPPELKNFLWGKLLHLRMIRSRDDPIYTRLADKYNFLCKSESKNMSFQHSLLPVEPIVRNAQDADRGVFVIEWSGDYQGTANGSSFSEPVGMQATAFAYKNVGLITCAHALFCEGMINGASYEVDVMSSNVFNKNLSAFNPATGRTRQVKVVHYDRHRDLAILKFTDSMPFEKYFSGADKPINRNEQATLVGFPNWSPGRLANQLIVSIVMLFNTLGFKKIEISGNIRKGISGGPLVDNLYRVVGIAQTGSTQASGNDECLCVSELDNWIDSLLKQGIL